MARRLICILLAFGLLLGGAGAPALAIAGPSNHMFEMLDLDCHETTQANDEKGDSGQDMPGHVGHHHCSVGFVLHESKSFMPFAVAKSPVHPVLVQSLASHATAPLTEPPAA